MLSILISPEHYVSTVLMIGGILSLTTLETLSVHFANSSKVKGSLLITIWGIIATVFAVCFGSLFNGQPV